MENEDTTSKPPLVLFGRYGSNSHYSKATDRNHFFVAAAPAGPSKASSARSDRRNRSRIGKKLKNDEILLGRAGSHSASGISRARQQELAWIKLAEENND